MTIENKMDLIVDPNQWVTVVFLSSFIIETQAQISINYYNDTILKGSYINTTIEFNDTSGVEYKLNMTVFATKFESKIGCNGYIGLGAMPD